MEKETLSGTGSARIESEEKVIFTYNKTMPNVLLPNVMLPSVFVAQHHRSSLHSREVGFAQNEGLLDYELLSSPR